MKPDVYSIIKKKIFKVGLVGSYHSWFFHFEKKTQLALGLATEGPIKRETKQKAHH